MTEIEETFTVAFAAAGIFGLRYQTAPQRISDHEIDVRLVEPPHLVNLQVRSESAIRVYVALHFDRAPPKHHHEVVRAWESHHDLADRIDEVYQRALAGSP